MLKEFLTGFFSKGALSRRNFVFCTGLGLGVMGSSMIVSAETAAAQGKDEAPKADAAPFYPRSLAHVGLTVPDIDAALKWYMKVFGWTRLFDPAVSVAKQGYMGELAADLYGPEFRENKMAMLSTGNGANVEFFEYVNPNTRKFKHQPGPWAPGFSHICVMDPDIQGMVKRIVANGGKQVSKIWNVAPPGSNLPYEICYTQDPWGNFVEVCTRSSDQLMRQSQF